MPEEQKKVKKNREGLVSVFVDVCERSGEVTPGASGTTVLELSIPTNPPENAVARAALIDDLGKLGFARVSSRISRRAV